MSASLADVLSEISSLRCRRGLREWLLGKAVESAAAAAVVNRVSSGDGDAAQSAVSSVGNLTVIVDFEAVLSVVGDVAGMASKPTVSAAKAWLRGRGEHALASRLGRFSKFRNAKAHPDRGLEATIRRIDGGAAPVTAPGAASEPALEPPESTTAPTVADQYDAGANYDPSHDVAHDIAVLRQRFVAVVATAHKEFDGEALVSISSQAVSLAGTEVASSVPSGATWGDTEQCPACHGSMPSGHVQCHECLFGTSESGSAQRWRSSGPSRGWSSSSSWWRGSKGRR